MKPKFKSEKGKHKNFKNNFVEICVLRDFWIFMYLRYAYVLVNIIQQLYNKIHLNDVLVLILFLKQIITLYFATVAFRVLLKYYSPTHA